METPIMYDADDPDYDEGEPADIAWLKAHRDDLDTGYDELRVGPPDNPAIPVSLQYPSARDYILAMLAAAIAEDEGRGKISPKTPVESI